MNKRIAGGLLIGLVISFALNIYLINSTEKQSDISTLEQKHSEKLENKDQRIKELEEIINRKSDEGEKEDSKNQAAVREFLSAFYTFKKETSTTRFERIKELTTPELYKELSKLPKEDADVNQSDTSVTIDDIEIFSDNNGKYLAKYSLSFVMVGNQKNKQDAIALVEVAEGKVSAFTQPAI
ncbi:hypothetical protein [Enterococcus sp. AZ072]|uniref:hypothetical protein n=1 Tax=unclassified Enterococcus TaxID=2608891 RepID=UPI003D292AAD